MPHALLMALSASLAVLLAPAATALACGAFFRTATSQNLAIGAQRALMVVGEDALALHLQLTADTDGAAFSWVVPIPRGGGPPTVTLGDQAIFDALDALTTPTVSIRREGGGGGGLCAGDSAKSAPGGRGDGGGSAVQHFGGGDLGPYTYDVIAGSDTTDVEAWLTDNAYVVPDGFADAIAPYTARSVFVAVRLQPDAASDDALLRPLAVTWPRAFDGDLGYAFGLSRLSAPAVQPLLLWILADKRQRIANYGSSDLDLLAATMEREDLDYDEAVTALTEDAGGRLVITEFAQDLRALAPPEALAALVADDSFYLTRLYAEVPRDAIEDLVITFAANAPDVEPHVEISHGGGAGGDGALLASSMLALAWWRRLSRSRSGLQ